MGMISKHTVVIPALGRWDRRISRVGGPASLANMVSSRPQSYPLSKTTTKKETVPSTHMHTQAMNLNFANCSFEVLEIDLVLSIVTSALLLNYILNPPLEVI